ncbi:TNF receptor-associated factor 5-like [Acropora millepora]|nr:TNF receptor-associated factor 5-like [Acropora millepora]
MLFNLIMNFISPYSLSTMLRPVTLSCGHSGCQDCLAKLSAMATHPRCPLCKKNIDSDLNINFSLHAITSHFEVYCTNDGCQWKGNFGCSEEHSNRCGKFKIQCENNGCHQFLRREEMESHLLECPKQQTSCSHCGGSIAREWLQTHITSWCSRKLISCPLGCKMILPRYHLTLHFSECPEKAIRCHVSGCTAIVRRKHMQEHVLKAASSHAILQEGKVQRLLGIMHFKKRSPVLE